MGIGRMPRCKSHKRYYAHMCVKCDEEVREGKRKPEEKGLKLPKGTDNDKQE